MGQRCIEREYKHRKSVRSVSRTPKALLHLGFCLLKLSANCQPTVSAVSQRHAVYIIPSKKTGGENMNQFRVMGMVDAEYEIMKQSSPSDFSDDLYDGVSLYCRKDKKTVVLFVSKDAEPARWKVLDGACEFHFRTFAEASKFCQMRGYIFIKGEKRNEMLSTY